MEYPLLLSKIYSEKGFYLRAAGDYLHKYLPHWPIFKFFGAFDGSRESCAKLMKAGQNVVRTIVSLLSEIVKIDFLFFSGCVQLIFPGGGREVLKRKSDKKYELMWKDRESLSLVCFVFLCLCLANQFSFGSPQVVDLQSWQFSMDIP